VEQDTNGAFLYCMAAGVISGVALALTTPLGVVYPAAGIGASLVLIALGAALTKQRHNKKMFLAAIFLASLALGVLRADSFLLRQQQQSLLPYASANAKVEGIVTNDPERRATSLHVNIDVQKINGAPVRGELLAILGRDGQLAYGDSIILEGRLEEPQPFLTDTGHLFDYKGYLEVQGISAMMPQASIAGVTHNGFAPQYFLQTFLYSTKHKFEESVEQLFPEPDGSLLEGILLGERRGIPQNLTQAFVASSLVHVVVLSGHNITIVSEGVFRTLAFLPRAAGYSLSGALMIVFALMTGAGATTVRALIMALVALLARYVHRSALALRSLSAAAAAMVVWNPPSLLHDSSFILSVLATFGLITLAPWVEQKIWRVPNYKHFDVRSIVATTIAVEIFVTPALLYFNGTLSFFALPANILALPAVPFAMLCGFIAGLVGFVSPTLALLPTVLCDLFLKWILLVATTTQSLPYSTATVAEFPVWILLAVYLPLTGFSILRYRSAALSQTN
jgi:ComEC/Rec2-related protein